MESSNKHRMEELIIRYCEGPVTEEEREQVQDWMEESDENKRMVQQICSLYLATDTLHIMDAVSTEKGWRKMEKRMVRNRSGNHRQLWTWVQRIAAVMLIPVLILWMLQYHSKDSQNITLVEVKSSPGMSTSFTLPDGTLVFLNSASKLVYPSRFEKNARGVTLVGEAYFEVAKDHERVFTVSTPHNARIEVLGTHFNVEAYEEEESVLATLLEGKISFVFRQGDELKKVMMKPGNKLVYDSKNESIQLYHTSGKSEVGWTEGKIILENTSLEEALHLLEKRFHVDFLIRNERLKEYTFTGTFTNQTLERILDKFRLSSQIRWHYLDDADNMNGTNRIEIYE